MMTYDEAREYFLDYNYGRVFRKPSRKFLEEICEESNLDYDELFYEKMTKDEAIESMYNWLMDYTDAPLSYVWTGCKDSGFDPEEIEALARQVIADNGETSVY